MPTNGVFARAAAATVAGVALLGLTACARPTAGTAVPAATTTETPPPTTVVTPPPATVYVVPETVTVPKTPAKPLTPCQRLHADGYSYAVAYTEWELAGYPANWDADHDGFPCEQSYGEQ